MTEIFSLNQILKTLNDFDLIEEISMGFISLSKGHVVVPPIGEMLFPEVNGELHIKYGAINGDDSIVIKIATGFFQNPELGLPPFNGCMLVLSQKTGELKAVLLEEGELTNHRTAAAGAVVAKYLSPKRIETIGIVGTGVQARLQALYLQKISKCRKIMIWGRNELKSKVAALDLRAMGYQVTVTNSLIDLCDECRLIVTSTPSRTPLLTAEMIHPGTHITAMGSDTEEKCELSPNLLEKADVVCVDSLEQSKHRGEVSQALKAMRITINDVVEIGQIIIDPLKGRTSENQISIADLTGVAIQDIVVAKAVTERLLLKKSFG